MKHRFLIFIDGLFKPLYVVMNAFKRRKKPECENQHFIVLKFFGLGSITRIFHVMTAIGIPKDQVTFITLHKNKSIINLLGLNARYVNTRHPLTLVNTLIGIVVHVWKLKKTTVLDMERASNISGLLRLLIGYGKPCHSFYFKPKNQNTKSQFFVSLKDKPATHAIAEMFCKIYIKPVTKFSKVVDPNKIFVNINAGNYIPERKFSLLKYAELLKKLHDKNNHWHFYLTGLKSEHGYVSSFKEHLTKFGIPAAQIHNIAGQHGLSELIVLLEKARLFITNDSGPLHLAHLFGIKTVGIWGPTSSKIVGYKDNNLMLNLNPKIDCSPCFVSPKSQIAKICNGTITCFKNRDIDYMAGKIISFVKLEKGKEVIA